MKLFLGLCFFLTLAGLSPAQFFDPELDDKTYLDRIEEQINVEVENSALDLLDQTKIAEKITKTYIKLKLKDNVFKALRTLAENEIIQLEQGLNGGPKGRKGLLQRQEDADAASGSGGEAAGGGEAAASGEAAGGEAGGEAAGGGEEADDPPTTPLNGLSTAVKINQNVFNFLGETFKLLFKGLGGKSFTRAGSDSAASPFSTTSEELVTALPSLMNKPYAEQLVGILSLLTKDGDGLTRVNQTDRAQRLPLSILLGDRVRSSTFLKASSSGERTNDLPKPVFMSYVENLKRSQPWLLPDLYQGIPAASRLLTSMSTVVNQIKNPE